MITGDCRETAGSRQPAVSGDSLRRRRRRLPAIRSLKSPRLAALKIRLAKRTRRPSAASSHRCANCLSAHRDFGKAIAAYSEAIRLNRTYTLAHQRPWALAYVAGARYGEAIADYSQTRWLDPQFGLAYHQRGEALMFRQTRWTPPLRDFNAWI